MLRVLMWPAPTLLNPQLAVGTKDWDASRMFYEPLASFDSAGDLVPVLAREVPTVENGGVAKDGRSVTWKLKSDVRWHDGARFTAEDVVFTAQYISDPATGSPQSLRFREVERVEALHTSTVKVSFKQPTPFPWGVFCGLIMTIPRHVFEPYQGAKSREAPANLKPVGTGPYRYVDFKPGDLVKAELNPSYHVPFRPFFDAVEIKGGGDAVSAARAVLQIGDYDYAPYMSGVEDDILRRLETRGRGKLDFVFAGDLTHIQINHTDPWTEVDGERSSIKTVHPFLSDLAVRTALSLLVDRRAIQEQILGRTGTVTANWLNAPPRFESRNTRWEFSVEKANQVLDAAGWKRGANSIRARDGKKLRMVFQTAVNTLSQKIQAIVKQAAARAGIEIEVKAIAPTTFGSSDPANRDSYSHFNADLQLITYFQSTPDAERFMSLFTSTEIRRRRTTGSASTSRAGATTSTRRSSGPPRPRWTR